MVAVSPTVMESFEEHIVEGESKGALPLTTVTEFWLTAVNTFEVLYEASGTYVYSTDNENKHTSANSHRCIKYFEKAFPGKEKFLHKACF